MARSANTPPASASAVILGLAYALGWRPSLIVAVLAATAFALIGSNGPMTILGVTDPRAWGLVGWISDLIPHFGYGIVTALVLLPAPPGLTRYQGRRSTSGGKGAGPGLADPSVLS
ncbi:hypothetical protein [Mycobacterium simiae]|uniref:hypothetical protein n=1 Tax=Mycobacterium simiae TaxID=1784 RepID=UPI0021CD2D1A|nr:hypothetical protein [Mycobacterium simiae]